MKKFQKANKKTLILLDILMILGILSNAGAYTITNALVIKKAPTAQVYEVNPVAVATTNFAPPPKEVRPIMHLAFLLTILRFIPLGAALGSYIYFRQRMNNKYQLAILCIGIGIWFTTLYLNFHNDLGLYIGKILYG